jgi:hypothetical protein
MATLIKDEAVWHKQLGQERNQPSRSWRHSPIRDFRLVEGSEMLGNMRVWTITELLTNQELILEGRDMRHCVATYTERCVRRQASIWSMQMAKRRGRDNADNAEPEENRSRNATA